MTAVTARFEIRVPCRGMIVAGHGSPFTPESYAVCKKRGVSLSLVFCKRSTIYLQSTRSNANLSVLIVTLIAEAIRNHPAGSWHFGYGSEDKRCLAGGPHAQIGAGRRRPRIQQHICCRKSGDFVIRAIGGRANQSEPQQGRTPRKSLQHQHAL